MMKSALEAQGIGKSFQGRALLKGVSFAVENGQVFGLLGPNGAGKSTLLGILSGLYPSDAGHVKIRGRDLKEYGKDLHAFLGVVPQEECFYPSFSVEETLRFFGCLNGLGGAALNERVSALLGWLELRPFAATRAERLSGGYRRLLNIACSLVHDPDLVFFDEPTVALDPNVRHTFWKKIVELKKQGKAIVLTTHYMEEAQKLCDELAILFHGEILAHGSPKELIARFGGEKILALRAAEGTDLEREKELLAGIHRLYPKAGVQWKHHFLFVSLPERNQVEAAGKIVSLVEGKGIKVLSQQLKEPELEDVFIHLTGERHLPPAGVKASAKP